MKYFNKITALFLALVFCIVTLHNATLKVSAYDTNYPNTWVNTGNQIDDIIGVALTQVGYHGIEYVTGTKYGAWYGMTMAPWCGMFVSWCAAQANIPSSIICRSASAGSFRNSGTYHYKDDYNPVKGDLCLYNPTNGGYYWPSKDSSGKYSSTSHVALVVSYDASSGIITIVHGNATDDRVCLTNVAKSATKIQAFVTPPYTTGTASQNDNYSYINGSDVRIRQTPGGTIIRNLSYGTYLDVLESTTDNSGDKWYKVKVMATGEVGYVYGEYVTVKEETVPQTPSNQSDTPDITGGQAGYINDSSVRIRNGVGTSNTTVLAVLDYDTKLTVLESEKDSDGDVWYKVVTEQNKIEGYVFSKYVTLTDTTPEPAASPAEEETQGYINGTDVRLRSGPSTSSDILAVLGLNESLKVLKIEGEWRKVRVVSSGVTGYVYGEYVSTAVTEKEPVFTGCLDFPGNNSGYMLSNGGGLLVYGWSFTDLGIPDVYLSIDGNTAIALAKTTRSDVKNVYQSSCPSAECGFFHSVDILTLGEGEHKLRIIAKYGEKEFLLGERTVQIINDTLPDVTEPVLSYTPLTGDANGDNKIDAKDLARLKKYLSGLTQEINLLADMNGDGLIDAKDLTRLKKHLSGS